MVQQLEQAIVRIFSLDRNKVRGGGFLIAPQYILTCAHVIALAQNPTWKTFEGNPTPPDEIFEIDFPMLAPKIFLSAKVLHWSPMKDTDMAVLELTSPIPAQAHPIPLKLLHDFSNRSYLALGFSRDNGRWSSGIMRGALANGHIQLDNGPTSQQPIEPGFSGTAIWDEQTKSAVGMVVRRVTEERNGSPIPIASMIPVRKLCEIWPPLKDFLPSPKAVFTTPRHVKQESGLRRAAERWDVRTVREIAGHQYFLTACLQEDESSVLGLVQRLYKARQIDGARSQTPHFVWIKQHALHYPEIATRQALRPLKKEGELWQKLTRTAGWPILEEQESLPESITLIYTALPWKSLADTFGLRGKPLDSQRACALLQAMPTLCTQLAQLHAQGYAHRMLTPESILLDKQRRSQAVLRDVGLATQPFQPGEGPPSYMAPEQVHRGYALPGTDIYQVGALLYHLLVGEKPSAFLYGVEPPSQRNSALPAALDAVVLRALQEDVQERWADINEFAAALKQCLKEFTST